MTERITTGFSLPATNPNPTRKNINDKLKDKIEYQLIQKEKELGNIQRKNYILKQD